MPKISVGGRHGCFSQIACVMDKGHKGQTMILPVAKDPWGVMTFSHLCVLKYFSFMVCNN